MTSIPRFVPFLLILSLLLAACAPSGTQSCKASSDCTSKQCQSASCTGKECSYAPQSNCCGNGKKDPIEGTKPGNECTCPQDYGVCEGAAKVSIGGSRAEDAVYVKRHCSAMQECIMGVDPKDLKPITLLDEGRLASFDIEITTTINQPFRVPTDSLSFRIRLKDAKEEVIYPIKFTHISLRDGEILYGEKDVSAVLGGIGDIATFSVPLIYSMGQPEENRRIGYKMDYEYTLNTQNRDSSGNLLTTPKTMRESLENRFGTPLIFAQDGVK